MGHYSQLAAERLDELGPEERSRVYKMLSLTDLGHADGKLEARWAFGGDPRRDNELLPPGSFKVTTYVFEFSALLTED